MDLRWSATHQGKNSQGRGRSGEAPGKSAGGEQEKNAEETGNAVEGSDGIGARYLVPKVPAENVKKPSGRKDNSREFLLTSDVSLGQVRVACDSVLDELFDVLAVKPLIESDVRVFL